MATTDATSGSAAPLGTDLPDGTRFIGPENDATPGWIGADFPAPSDLDACVACGLCLPHCPTYRLTGEESASPRGRIAAMRAVAEGGAAVDATFASFMDACLSCRACEDACPSHVPFGRMMERARVQIEPVRSRRERLVRWFGLDVAPSHPRVLGATAGLAPLVRGLLPRRLRALVPPAAGRDRGGDLPTITEPSSASARGTVALLSGCIQDRWYRPVNRATIRVLARNGWRVVVPPGQRCCGALAAHYGRLDAARRLARHNLGLFADVDWIVVNAAGCGAHAKEYGELLPGSPAAALAAGRTRDAMEFLDDHGIEPPGAGAGLDVVASHEPCHAIHAQHVGGRASAVLRRIPGLDVVTVDASECCGAAGLYNVLEPRMSEALRARTCAAVERSGARVVATANPGCMMQIAAGMRARGIPCEVVHPIELLDRAYSASVRG